MHIMCNVMKSPEAIHALSAVLVIGGIDCILLQINAISSCFDFT